MIVKLTDALKDLIAQIAPTRRVAALATATAEGLERLSAGNGAMLGLQDLARLSGLENPRDEDMRLAADILCRSEIGILRKFGMIFDPDGEEHEVEDEDLDHFFATGEIIHPKTGEPCSPHLLIVFHERVEL